MSGQQRALRGQEGGRPFGSRTSTESHGGRRQRVLSPLPERAERAIWEGRSRAGVARSRAQERGFASDEHDEHVAEHDRGWASSLSPALSSWQMSYDARGRLRSIVQGTRTSTYGYDANGYLGSVTDPASRVESLTNDAVGRTTSDVLPGPRTVGFGYDSNSNVTSVTPPGKTAHALTYTPVNLEATYTPPLVGTEPRTTQYAYNADRQVTQATRPDGSTVVFAYDSAGRLSTTTIARGTITNVYDATKGTLTSITAPGVAVGGNVLSFGYDGKLVTDVTWSGDVAGTLHRTYDANFRVASDAVSGGTAIAYAYDNDSLLTGAGSLTLTRDPQNGRVTGTTLSAATDTITYDPTYGELATYTANSLGAAVLTHTYTRDALGRITRKVETVDGATHTYDYAYDARGFLSTVKIDGSVVSTYLYDDNGNRTSLTTSSGTVTGTYDSQDRMTAYGTKTYTYTPNGELSTKTVGGATTTYTYDALGNLTAVALPGGTNVAYVIDGANRRVGKKVGGALVQGFVYQDQLGAYPPTAVMLRG